MLHRLQGAADALWDNAEQISDEAGFPYKNRKGVQVYPKGEIPQLSNDIIKQVVQLIWTKKITPPHTPL